MLTKAITCALALAAAPLLMGPTVVVIQPAAVAGYAASATTFAGDGQCWMERDADLTGNADAKTGSFSCWVNFSGLDGVLQHILMNNGERLVFQKRTTNLIRLSLKQADNTVLVTLDQNSANVAAILAGSGWHHILASWDKSVENRAHLYIDGVECLTITNFLSDDVDGNTNPIDYTRTDWAVGASDAGAAPTAACISELWFSTEYIDFSVQANREEFRSAGGDPVDLGATGATPTGNQPLIYLRSAFSSFTTNAGSGGNFVKKGTTDFTSCTAP